MPNPRVPRRPASKTANSEKSGKAKWIVAILLLLLMAGGAFAFLPMEDPGVARIHDLREEMEGASDERRREIYDQMRAEYEKLPEEVQDQLREERRARWEAEERKRLADFFALSPDEQVKELDESIKREEARRREREQRRGDAGDRGGRRDRGRRGGSMSDDPNARRRRYLDRTDAQTRAMRGEYWRRRQERRQKLGLTHH